LVRSNHNRAEEVKAHAEDNSLVPQLIILGADLDLVQGMKIIDDLSKKLTISD
jgi:hypothetical protein